MESFRHAFSTLRKRLRWEISGFLVLIFASAVAEIAAPATRAGLSSVAIIAFGWLTLRIVLSEAGFLTHGGWRTRPYSANSILFARITLILILALVACLVRALTLQHLFRPSADQWLDHLKIVLFGQLLPWLAFVAALVVIALVLRIPMGGRKRKMAGSLVGVVLLAVIAVIQNSRSFSSSGQRLDPQRLSAGIQRLLPEATQFIGQWKTTGLSAGAIQAKQIARIPLAGWDTNPAPGVRLLRLDYSVGENTVQVTLGMSALDQAVVAEFDQVVPVLAYADGSYGAVVSFDSEGRGFPGMIFRGESSIFYQVTFASPLSLPENRDADPALFFPRDILFFADAVELSEIPLPADSIDFHNDSPAPPSAIPSPVDPQAFHRAVTSLIDSLGTDRDSSASQRSLIASLPPAAIEPILTYHPWSENVWKELVQPFLVVNATDAHKPVLLARLASDPRLASVFIRKGWTGDAAPVLRRRATERLPLDAEAITLLAQQNDPAIAADLAAISSRLWGVEKLAPVLRASSGFDWPGFVALGWKHHKHFNYERQGWHYARWAAELGDPSALRRLAEEAAAGKKWETMQLKELVAGEHEDFIGYLRENIDRMKFDPVTRKWGVDDP